MNYVLGFIFIFIGALYFYRAYIGVMTLHLVTLAASERKPATAGSRAINVLLGVCFLFMGISHLARI